MSAFVIDRQNQFLHDTSPSLHGLVMSGLTPPGLHLIQCWLDRTGDIQTAALLSSYFPLSRLAAAERVIVARWQEGYRDLLDSWGMWAERVAFDKRRLELSGESEVEEGKTCPA